MNAERRMQNAELITKNEKERDSILHSKLCVQRSAFKVSRSTRTVNRYTVAPLTINRQLPIRTQVSQRRRLLPPLLIQPGDIEVCVGVIRVELDGPLVRGDGIADAAKV